MARVMEAPVSVLTVIMCTNDNDSLYLDGIDNRGDVFLNKNKKA